METHKRNNLGTTLCRSVLYALFLKAPIRRKPRKHSFFRTIVRKECSDTPLLFLEFLTRPQINNQLGFYAIPRLSYGGYSGLFHSKLYKALKTPLKVSSTVLQSIKELQGEGLIQLFIARFYFQPPINISDPQEIYF